MGAHLTFCDVIMMTTTKKRRLVDVDDAVTMNTSRLFVVRPMENWIVTFLLCDDNVLMCNTEFRIYNVRYRLI